MLGRIILLALLLAPAGAEVANVALQAKWAATPLLLEAAEFLVSLDE